MTKGAKPAATLRRERQRVAKALHNTLCQELMGISLLTSAAARQLQPVCPEAEEKLREIAGLIQHASANLREFVRGLQEEG